MIELITAALGIAGTVFAWYFNPKQALYRELDSIYKQLEQLYALRDKALQTNDSNAISDINSRIIGLCEAKNSLLKRLG